MIVVHQDKNRIRNFPRLSFGFYSRDTWENREFFIAEDEAGKVLGVICYVPEYNSIYAPEDVKLTGKLFSYIGVVKSARNKGVAQQLLSAFFAACSTSEYIHITGIEMKSLPIMVKLLDQYRQAGYQMLHRATPWSVDNCIS